VKLFIDECLSPELAKRLNISTTRRMASGEESNHRNGLGAGLGALGLGFIQPPYPARIRPW
jgi:hypothetical protein